MHERMHVEFLLRIVVKIANRIQVVLGIDGVQPRVPKVVCRIEVHEIIIHARKYRPDALRFWKALRQKSLARVSLLITFPVGVAILPDLGGVSVVSPLSHDEGGFERWAKQHPPLVGMCGGEGLKGVAHLALDQAHERQETDQSLIFFRPTFGYGDGQGRAVVISREEIKEHVGELEQEDFSVGSDGAPVVYERVLIDIHSLVLAERPRCGGALFAVH